MQNSDFWTPITNLYGSQTSPVVLWMQYIVISTRITCLWVPNLICGFCMQNSDFRTRITSLCRWIYPTCGFCMQNSVFWTRITSLCGSQTSPAIFCMENSVPSIKNTSLRASQSLRVVFGCKTATYGPEKQVSMGPRHDQSLWECKTALLASD